MQALLLALANPYGFMPGQLGQVHPVPAGARALGAHHRRRAGAPAWRRRSRSFRSGTTFRRSRRTRAATIDGSKLFLLTFDLAFQLQEQLRALEAGGLPPAGIGGDPAAKAEYMALLRRLLRQWAIPPARQFNRLPSRARVVMCAGLPASGSTAAACTRRSPTCRRACRR